MSKLKQRVARSSAEYPRVLVVTNVPFSLDNSNGKTMRSLFLGWPTDRLAQVYIPFASRIVPDFDVCGQYWALTPIGLRRVTQPPAGARSRPPSAARSWLASRASDKRVAAVAYPIRELVYSNPALWRGASMREIEAFAPQLIFSMVASVSGLRMVNRLSDRFGIPVVPHITDDWITTEYSGALFSQRLRSELTSQFREYLGRSPVRLVISDAMAEAYRQRYGGTFHPFTQGIDQAAYDPRPHGEASEQLRLVYAGNLAQGRTGRLLAIADRLSELARCGLAAELVVHSNAEHLNSFGSQFRGHPHVRVAGNVPARELPLSYRGADILVHVDSFDRDFSAYHALSLSTKISEYLMAGRALFGHGPGHHGSMKHMAASGAAVVVDTEEPQAIEQGLKTILADPQLRERLGRAGREFALERHEMHAQHDRFVHALQMAAHTTSRRPAASDSATTEGAQ